MKFRSILVCCLCMWAFGMSGAHVAASTSGEEPYTATIQDLEALLRSVNNLKRMLTATQAVLRTPEAVGREAELRSKIEELSQKIAEMEASFERLSTGVDPGALKEEVKEEINLHQQLTELLIPLFREIKRITARPREMERLRGELASQKERLQVIEGARSHLLTLLSRTTDSQLTESLNRMVRTWDQKEKEVAARIAVTNQQLDMAAAEKKSLSQSVKDLAQVFFKTRGKNLFIALAVFALVWLGLHYLHKVIVRVSPFHKEGRSVAARAFDLLYIVFEVIFSFFLFAGVLYILGDWVLLSLAIIFALGVAWASKQAFPRIRSEATLMLNFGTVREGEVVVYNGIPYEVASLNIHSILKNKVLGDGMVRLHIKDLVDLRSRPAFEDEVWFPSKKGDWVVLGDATHGEVVGQTPEIVQIRMLGGATKSYKTQDYLSQSPTNLSQGFRIRAAFGLDYQHQSVITQEIPEIIERSLKEKLAQEGYADGIERIRVEFSNAGASSLDLAVLADFKGTEGRRYSVLQRAIQRICVETCSEHGWLIPFQQMTVHIPGGMASK